MDILDVLEAMESGQFDDQLSTIGQAINDRHRAIRDRDARRNMAVLNSPGTRVRLHGLRPKYLNGRAGEVVETPSDARAKRGTMHVKLDNPVPRYGEVVNVPASAVEAE